MFEKRLAQLILKEMEVEPTVSQNSAIEAISSFLFDDNQESVFLLKGYAGTGKTLLISTIVKSIKQFRVKTELLAPTGRAAKVLSAYTSQQAFTIHKKFTVNRTPMMGLAVSRLITTKTQILFLLSTKPR